MHSVLNKNPGLNCLKLVKDIHCGNIAEWVHYFGQWKYEICTHYLSWSQALL
jgi:hypothetical protein